ncbi:hypothetical protein [Chitinophaga agri]|uniref:Uncharacterized protein n=1 Tax=Chitinophaga agri TaxID=2703787 RepID=A0A6B9ZF55_9BACT|nr:hypothetical protein [Chitinophaga agri]QHS61008.1 hypothetical protein GWR21_15810 [Chitinophaga agri]
MQTNNVFSPARFGLYMRKHLLDNYRLYAMSVIVLAVLSLILLLVSSTDNFSITASGLVPIFFIMLFITGLIFTSLSFGELGNKPQGIDYLLFPASQLEKFLSTLLVTTVGFLLVYHLAFYIAYQVMDMIVFAKRDVHIVNDLRNYLQDTPAYYWYYAWFGAQGFMLLGAVYFQKYSFIKTLFLLTLFLGALYLVNTVFVFLFFGGKMREWYEHVPFIGVNITNGGTPVASGNTMLIIPEPLQHTFLFLVKYILPPMLWTLAYARLRDKEI